MTDAPKGSLGFSAGTDWDYKNSATDLELWEKKTQLYVGQERRKKTEVLQTLTTFKKVVNRSDLQDPLHVFMQYANFRLPVRVDDKFWQREKRKAQVSNWTITDRLKDNFGNYGMNGHRLSKERRNRCTFRCKTHFTPEATCDSWNTRMLPIPAHKWAAVYKRQRNIVI